MKILTSVNNEKSFRFSVLSGVLIKVFLDKNNLTNNHFINKCFVHFYNT
jgi:hypothetical protein